MYSNYVASRLDYEDIGSNKLLIDGKVYTYNSDNDPEYQQDGVLDISYWHLYDEDGEQTDMVYAFEHIECEDPQEWSDEYDNPHVLIFK